MNVPFLNLQRQYSGLWKEIEPELREIFSDCNFVGGSKVKKFEDSLCEYLGVKYAVGVNSCTDALVIALRACGIGYGDEVITTPFSFFATAEAISQTGATPVFVDIRRDDYTIDPACIESAISNKTRAIIPVQIFGAVCDMDAINDIAGRHNLKVIEDDAQAIGSTYRGRMAGTMGDVGCFSFYPTKNLGGCGDGGMIVTNNEDLYIAAKALHKHGAGADGARAARILYGEEIEIEKAKEKTTELYNPHKYYNYLIGYNSRLDSIQAAVLNIKLKHVDDYNRNRRRIAERYLKDLPDKVRTPLLPRDVASCWHQFAVTTEYKEELCQYLADSGVGCGAFYPVPLHKQKAFNQNNSRVSVDRLTEAENVCKQTVCLPIFPEMTDSEVDYVIDVVNRFYRGK